MSKNYNIYVRSQGESMYPLIKSSSELLININKKIIYQTGDLVCFLKKEGLIVHRVIKSCHQDKKFLLQGDNNLLKDGFYKRNDIYGKVKYIIDNGIIIDTAKNKSINKLIAYLIRISKEKNLYFLLFTPIRYSLVYLIKILNKNTGNKELQQIISSIKSKKTKPTSEEHKIDSELFKVISLKNKFLNFNPQDKKRSSQQKFFLKVLNKEKKNVFKNLKTNQIKFVSLDNLNPENEIEGSDIDILVNKSQLKETILLLENDGFFVKNKYAHEVTLINKTNSIQVDLHFLINFPRDFYFNKKSSQELTKDFIQIFTKKNNKYKNEYFLLSKITAFWTNDFLKGFYTLRSLGKFVEKEKVNWQHFNEIAKKYSFLGESQLALSICNNIFPSQKLKKYIKNVNKKNRIISHYFTDKKVGLFGSIIIWGQENDINTYRIYLDCYLASLLVNKNTSFLRLIKPRILLFLIKSIQNNIVYFLKVKFLPIKKAI